MPPGVQEQNLTITKEVEMAWKAVAFFVGQDDRASATTLNDLIDVQETPQWAGSPGTGIFCGWSHDLSVWKVGVGANMVGVQVSRHDGAHVTGFDILLRQLGHSADLTPALHANHFAMEKIQMLGRLIQLSPRKARVHQDNAMRLSLKNGNSGWN
jgi:hypothetical protein